MLSHFTSNNWVKAIGNIINLRKTTISYEPSSERVLFNLGSDIRYVLDHYHKYISPLKDTDRRVCISIEGANSGMGFCNISDEQIEDLVEQISTVINQYDLDGVNLWDRNSGYGKDKCPAMNTTSYPKFVKRLREKLGNQRLITITDYESPTEYFWDVNAMAGIEIGKYIDYAWSGYNNLSEGFQIVDPYHQEEDMVSKIHPRRPIAGLSSKRYGCINAPWGTAILEGDDADAQYERVYEWVEKGLLQNKICVYEDLRTNLQDELEGVWTPGELIDLINSGQSEYVYSCDISRLELIEGHSGYNKWLKDW